MTTNVSGNVYWWQGIRNTCFPVAHNNRKTPCAHAQSDYHDIYLPKGMTNQVGKDQMLSPNDIA